MEDSLYDKICELEKNHDALRQSFKMVQEAGLTVHGTFPDFHQEAKKLLDQEPYRSNPYVLQCRGGRSLSEIVDEVAAETQYFLKFNKTARKAHNEKVKYLSEIVPQAFLFERDDVLNIWEPEGIALRMAALGGLIWEGFLVLGGENPFDHLVSVSLVSGSFGLFVGAMYGTIHYLADRPKGVAQYLKKNYPPYLNQALDWK